MDKYLKLIIKENVERLMKLPRNVDRNTPATLAGKCYYPKGCRKGGKKVAARTLGYLFEIPDNPKDNISPSVDLVQAVAKGLDVSPWELMVDSQQEKRNILDKILNSNAPTDAYVEKKLGKPNRHEGTKQ